MKKLTVLELINFLEDYAVCDDAEILFEDSNETGVHISDISLELVGNTYCLVFKNEDVSIVQ